jgi:hypothetical protein
MRAVLRRAGYTLTLLRREADGKWPAGARRQFAHTANPSLMGAHGSGRATAAPQDCFRIFGLDDADQHQYDDDAERHAEQPEKKRHVAGSGLRL